ncbi:hypothetical protein M8C21_012954 [Ambrosia artemisiifolia]|uniref:Cyclic nucleotide-binding domain-containing protein n=1 Tax=Ambrosia artemisiifolia TaxID=4212 RepID=A0AAD5CV65_AMBAR|nr:hypothetical protein M8C21_012954 [Ambrosia artemisiifolia]
MNHRPEKFVRFEDWKSEKSSNGGSPQRFKTALGSVSSMFRKSLEHGSGGVKNLKRSMGTHSLNRILSRGLGSGTKTLNPQGKFLQKWNKIFVLSCLIAVSVDPLFFYIPIVKEDKKCLDLDSKLQITASVLRSFTDIFYIVHIIFQFRTGFIPPSSRVFGRGVLVEDAWEIAKRYLSSYFLVDILAVLPLPQVVIWIIIPKLRGSRSLNTKNLLKFIVFFQYIPRMLRIYPLYKEVTRTSGILTETAWAGAAFNLFLYMLASHVFGAFWYLSSIERETTCWRKACGNITANIGARVSDCVHSSFYCDSRTHHVQYLNASCPIVEMDNPPYDFGIFLPALESGVVNSTDFPQKFFYCFWWGLQNLSSLGQNLKTSTFVWEICFAVFISISGLVLFSFLIGNMQTYLQSTTIRLEEMRVKRRDAEQWMSHRLLPEHLKERIRRYEQYKWQETRGVDEDNLIRNLPKDLRRDIKRHLCLKLLKRVPMFEKMDDQLMDALCDRLKPVLYTEKSYIVREGDPVDEMHFLLTWALDPHTSSNLPISTRTVQALEEVEAFALMADDLKFVASQFRRLHSKQLRHTFRFYSQQWRTWAACFIQAAWRRHCRKKLEDSLREEEDRLQSALTGAGGSSPSLGATIYASRFAANALRALRRNGARKGRIPEKLPPLMLQKPAEPDFTAED